ncbi:MAG: Rieske (2Fe-2S) protein, partial [Rhodospirillales bacterium]|nr:Rieske (2Fe-2S) protein [Rhodospirillales bacterium]
MRNAAGGRGRPGHAIPDQPAQQLPRDAYVDRAWFERERRDLFGCCWTCAGVVQDLAKPGEYVTVSAGDYPLMVLRDGSGTLRAFHNLCRHRGTELVEGSGRLERARISCPYHRWTYDLDGSLRAVP